MSAQMFCRSEGTNRSLKGGKVDDVTDSETNIEILTKPKITSKHNLVMDMEKKRKVVISSQAAQHRDLHGQTTFHYTCGTCLVAYKREGRNTYSMLIAACADNVTWGY